MIDTLTAEEECDRTIVVVERLAVDASRCGCRTRRRSAPGSEPPPGSASARLRSACAPPKSVISLLEEGGRAKNRLDTLARVAEALERHLISSFPEKVPARLEDAVQVA